MIKILTSNTDREDLKCGPRKGSAPNDMDYRSLPLGLHTFYDLFVPISFKFLCIYYVTYITQFVHLICLVSHYFSPGSLQ